MSRQYIRSERAHLMCPNMHFGIRFTLPGTFEPQQIGEALQLLAAAHPFLRSLVCREAGAGALFYAVQEESDVSFTPCADENALNQAWLDIAIARWDVFTEGLLKVFSCPLPGHTMFLFAAHHLLTDGRGLLGLACEFADCLAGGQEPKLAEERLITSLGDLPAGSGLSFVSRLVIDRANKQWRSENHRVHYQDYLDFSVAYGKQHPVSYRTHEMDQPTLEALRSQCRAAGVSVNDWLMAQVLLRTGANKLIFAADLRDSLPFCQRGALGNYATAMSITCRTKTAQPLEKAKEVHALVQKALHDPQQKTMVLACYLRMEPTLLDAAAISALGGFNSKAARFVGGAMFGFAKPAAYSVTNLGSIEHRHITFAEFIPPASPAARATLGVLTLNGVMRVVTSINGSPER